MLYIGIDLGTSAVKLVLMDEQGNVLRSTARVYPLYFPKPGWSEQDPAEWWEAVVKAMRELTANCDKERIRGIGVCGQMHGLIALDKQGRVLRPAILWNDGRTTQEVTLLNQTIGKETLHELTGNIAFAGFTAPKLLWMRKNEGLLFKRIDRILLPKDYIVHKLTGVFSTDVSDASGTLLFDVKNKCWSKAMLDICGLRKEQMPQIHESSEIVGTLLPEVAQELQLPQGIFVIAGAGDNAAAAVATGTVGGGRANLSVGTSGTLFVSSDTFCRDINYALHSFAHADGKYHLMGCILSAAVCNSWWCENILGTTDFKAEQITVMDECLGRNSVFFLPYLMGERSPINDTDARGVFAGMSLNTTRVDMTQAVLEGVAFALRDSFEVVKKLDVPVTHMNLCGGGARSPLWRKIIANVFNCELEVTQISEGPACGGAMLAAVGCGEYSCVEECTQHIVKITDVVSPEPSIAERYGERYWQFHRIYPALQTVFPGFKNG
ncbi:MAG: xylulokinase [Roseburia sp.]|nr:xylulokinase [Roseburia sp.]